MQIYFGSKCVLTTKQNSFTIPHTADFEIPYRCPIVRCSLFVGNLQRDTATPLSIEITFRNLASYFWRSGLTSLQRSSKKCPFDILKFFIQSSPLNGLFAMSSHQLSLRTSHWTYLSGLGFKQWNAIFHDRFCPSMLYASVP